MLATGLTLLDVSVRYVMKTYKVCQALRERYWAEEITYKELKEELAKLADKQVHFNFKGGQDGNKNQE